MCLEGIQRAGEVDIRGFSTSKIKERTKFLGLIALLLFAIVTSNISSASATPEQAAPNQDSSEKIVRIAYFKYGNYMNLDENGQPFGFAVDYFKEIEKYTDWEYEYIIFSTAQEAFASVSNGQADILPAIHYSEDRAEQFYFSSLPFCNASTTIYVNADNTDYAYEDFAQFDNMNIGILSGSRDAAAFIDYGEKHHLSPQLTSFDDTDSLMQALTDKVVDGVAIVYLGRDVDYKIVAQFASEPMYFALSNTRADLADELDEAISNISLRDPDFDTNLYKRYFGINTSQDPLFTREEYDYLSDAKPLKVVYEKNRAPLSSVDAGGEFVGASAKLFEEFSRNTGLEFEYVATESYAEGLEMVERGEADIIYAIDADLDDSPLEKTGVYLSTPMAKITSGTSNHVEVAAMPEDYWSEDKFIERPCDTFVYYRTPKECLEAVSEGEADAAYLDLNVAIHLLSDPRYEALHINALTNESNELCVGVSPQSNQHLVSILDRCVQYTPDDLVTQWITESSIDTKPLTVSDILRQYPLQVIAIIAMIAFLAVFAFGYFTWTRIRNEKKIAHLIYSDPLTGGWNLNRFQIEASELFKKDTENEYSILYFDFSRFKSFNAVFGFAEGDRLLISAKNLIERFVIRNEGECFAHITADEFVVLLRWRGWERFITRFEEYDRQLNELDVIREHAYRVMVIGGVCLVDQRKIENGGATVSGLIDCARYASESVGNKISRSSVTLYNEAMKERDVSERNLVSKAEAALHNNEFVAFYQPKVEIATNKIVGFEALARWISPVDGFRSPGEFIPLFEQNGFIIELDLLIFEQVCKRLRACIDRGESPVPISCNFSRRHLRENDLPEKLKKIASRYDVEPRYLELELTENILIEDFDRALEICQRLQAYGFPISIDDFGSGYSSLSTLQSLPVNILKLDRSFLTNEDINGQNKVILEGIIRIAGQMGITVVMEGVETSEQAEMLLSFDEANPGKNEGVIAQGFLYSRPVDLVESEKQIEKGFLEPREW